MHAEVARAGRLSFSSGSWAERELAGQCPEAFKLSGVFRVLVQPEDQSRPLGTGLCPHDGKQLQ